MCTIYLYQHLKKRKVYNLSPLRRLFIPETMLRADTINLKDHCREGRRQVRTILFSYKHSPQADAMLRQSPYSGIRVDESLAVWYCSCSRGAT